MVYEFDGTKYEKLRDMQAARRVKHRAWCAAARTSPGPPTRSVCPNAPGRSGATAGHVPPAATSGRSWTGAVAAWTKPSGSTPDTCAWTSASPSPTCAAPQRRRNRRRVRAAPRPADGHPPPQTPQATQDHARHTTAGRDRSRARQAPEPRTDQRQAPTRPPG